MAKKKIETPEDRVSAIEIADEYKNVKLFRTVILGNNIYEQGKEYSVDSDTLRILTVFKAVKE